ncbi:unnamed protein product, partial [Iphiclides podalirius]
MRVLVFYAAALACAAAAPCGTFIAHSPVPLVAIPPGDVQAAAIDAKVDVEDRLRAVSDQARELAEQANENKDEGVNEANDLAKEKAEEAFWAAEEQKWQALDAQKTAEALADASIASSAPAVTKAANAYPAAIFAPLIVDSSAAEVVSEAKVAAPCGKAKSETETSESEAPAAVKAAEVESKPAESADKPAEDVESDTVQVESAAEVKTEDVKKEEGAGFVALSQIHPAPALSASLTAQPWLNPSIAPITYVPGLRSYVSPFVTNYNGQLLNPVYFRAPW